LKVSKTVLPFTRNQIFYPELTVFPSSKKANVEGSGIIYHFLLIFSANIEYI